MALKSKTCIGKVSGKPLSEYWSEGEAAVSADHANSRYGRDLVPYRCRRCEFWHLAPRACHTPSYDCPGCTSGDGRTKQSYSSAEDAQQRADIRQRDGGVSLRVYPCPYGHGWHLTKGYW